MSQPNKLSAYQLVGRKFAFGWGKGNVTFEPTSQGFHRWGFSKSNELAGCIFPFLLFPFEGIACTFLAYPVRLCLSILLCFAKCPQRRKKWRVSLCSHSTEKLVPDFKPLTKQVSNLKLTTARQRGTRVVSCAVFAPAVRFRAAVCVGRWSTAPA